MLKADSIHEHVLLWIIVLIVNLQHVVPRIIAAQTEQVIFSLDFRSIVLLVPL